MKTPAINTISLSISTGIFLSLIEAADAHSTQIYVSTPFAPPAGWLWVPVLYIALHGIWFFVNRSYFSKRGIAAVEFALCTIAAIAVSFFLGAFFAGLNTAPPPGFGLPNPAFYGYGWEGWILLLFLIGNTVAIAIVFCCVKLFQIRNRITDKNRSKFFVLGPIGIYLICLIPYLAIGALSHGWHGGYVRMKCRSNLGSLVRGVGHYTKANRGRLPEGESAIDIFQQIKPYLSAPYDIKIKDILYCPVERSFNRHPQSYKWNAALSGKTLDELRQMPDNTPIFTCHNDHGFGSVSPEKNVQQFLMDYFSQATR